MKRVKSAAARLFCLPALPTVCIALPSFAAVIWVFTAGLEDTAFAYVAYAASAYGLVITLTGLPKIASAVRKGLLENPLTRRVRSTALGGRLLTDAVFRAQLSMYGSLCLNLLYVVWEMAFSVYYRSWWFGTLAAYYMLLAIMRFSLLRHVNKKTVGQDHISELRRYRMCGVMLLLMNQALAGVVIQMVRNNSGFVYPGLLIYVAALYAFCMVITAAVNMVRFRKYGSPVLSAAKAVSLTAAMVSVLALETAMLTRFGQADGFAYRRLMTGLSGTVICTLVLVMAVFMILRARKGLERLEKQNNKE